jgi:hypothetical protein
MNCPLAQTLMTPRSRFSVRAAPLLMLSEPTKAGSSEETIVKLLPAFPHPVQIPLFLARFIHCTLTAWNG